MPVLLLLILLAYTAPVFSQDPETGADIPFIHNTDTKWGRNEGVEIEYVRSFGNPAAEDPFFRLYEPRDAAVSAAGELCILDSGNFRILKFSADGSFLGAFGTRGIETGEFLLPTALAIDIKGAVVVADPGNNRYQLFNPDGTAGGTVPMTVRISNFLLSHSDDVLENLYSATQVFSESGTAETTMPGALVHMRDGSGDLLRSFGSPERFETDRTTYHANQFLLAADSRDNVYIAYRHRNVIEQYTIWGELQRRFDRELDYETDVRKILRDQSEEDNTADDIELPGITAGIAVDRMDRIWILTYRKQPEQEGQEDIFRIDIFNNEGTHLGKIDLDRSIVTPGNALTLHGDRLIITDTRHIMTVHEYRIKSK